MLHVLALLAATSVEPIVSTDWLQSHLNDPDVRIVDVSSRDAYDRAHIPGARQFCTTVKGKSAAILHRALVARLKPPAFALRASARQAALRSTKP